MFTVANLYYCHGYWLINQFSLIYKQQKRRIKIIAINFSLCNKPRENKYNKYNAWYFWWSIRNTQFFCSFRLIASVPGRHTGLNKTKWGHLKLRKVMFSFHWPFSTFGRGDWVLTRPQSGHIELIRFTVVLWDTQGAWALSDIFAQNLLPLFGPIFLCVFLEKDCNGKKNYSEALFCPKSARKYWASAPWASHNTP